MLPASVTALFSPDVPALFASDSGIKSSSDSEGDPSKRRSTN
jgi:hypothetical protein